MQSREELLSQLHNIETAAQATTATMDMGLEYEYVTKDGYGCSLGNMGDWPVHLVQNITPDFFNLIKLKIEKK